MGQWPGLGDCSVCAATKADPPIERSSAQELTNLDKCHVSHPADHSGGFGRFEPLIN
jgi:hypothetical protein